MKFYKFINNKNGRLILETSLVMPILILLVLNLLLITTFKFSYFIKEFVVQHNAIESVDEDKFNRANKIYERKYHTFIFNNLFERGYVSALSNTTSTQVSTDPIKLIRITNNFEHIKSIIAELNRSKEYNSDGISKKWDHNLYFDTHKSAAIYLRRISSGKNIVFSTPYGKRVVDSFDNSKVVHQAFLTFSERQLYVQLSKDAWLLKNGKNVNGVIWHFFLKNADTSPKLSTLFIEQAKERGVVIYFHNN